jgi:hypothetical protein
VCIWCCSEQPLIPCTQSTSAASSTAALASGAGAASRGVLGGLVAAARALPAVPPRPRVGCHFCRYKRRCAEDIVRELIAAQTAERRRLLPSANASHGDTATPPTDVSAVPPQSRQPPPPPPPPPPLLTVSKRVVRPILISEPPPPMVRRHSPSEAAGSIGAAAPDGGRPAPPGSPVAGADAGVPELALGWAPSPRSPAAGFGPGRMLGGRLIFPASGLLRTSPLDDDDALATGAETPYGFASYVSALAPTPSGPLSPGTATKLARAAAAVGAGASVRPLSESATVSAPQATGDVPAAFTPTHAPTSSPLALATDSTYVPLGLSSLQSQLPTSSPAATPLAQGNAPHSAAELDTDGPPAGPAAVQSFAPAGAAGAGANRATGSDTQSGSSGEPFDGLEDSDSDSAGSSAWAREWAVPSNGAGEGLHFGVAGPPVSPRKGRRRAPPLKTYPYLLLSDGRLRPMTLYTVSHHSEPSYAEFSLSNPRGFAAFLDLLPK